MLASLTKSRGIISKAAESAGIARSTHYNWIDVDGEYYDPEYHLAVKDIDESAIDHVESKLLEKIDGIQISKGTDDKGKPIIYDVPPSDTAIIFYLKTKGKKRGYVEKTEVDHTTKGDKITDVRPIVISVDGVPKSVIDGDRIIEQLGFKPISFKG